MSAAADTIAAACIVAAAVFIMRLLSTNAALARRAMRAERRFDLLQHLGPALTGAVADSAQATCARIAQRLAKLVDLDTVLCFMVVDGRLILGAKAGAGYASFLHVGRCYEGDTIVDWARDHAKPAIVGPKAASLEAQSGVEDLWERAHDPRDAVGPAAGSRDRVWALAAPLLRPRAYGLMPEVLGVLYAERPRRVNFSADDLATTLTVASLASDALQRALYSDWVRRTSDTDALTGLLTGASFRKRLREEIEARRYSADATSRDVALFFVDTDRFKSWNDTFGHAAGDRLLKMLADMFAEAAARASGFAGRNGGDEFCIALLDRTKDAAIAVGDALRRRIEGQEFMKTLAVVPDTPVHITVSIGVAHFPVDVARDDAQPGDKLLEMADAQMYEAKRAGRNRVAYARAKAQSQSGLHPGEGPIPRL
ncbi:MAG: sensor domain-containing diguanylate cyclase [Candidatus Eremiobacteraeota bacterium]|nr:sensor domain-containing diguanylate cyclase [Candidatus Eremiobacteraeota bacterium]